MVYLITVSPTINHRDSPEFIVSAFTLGISHPAGFPTYNLLAKAFTFFPFGSIAFKVNLFSVFFACLTLALLYATAIHFMASIYPDEDRSRFMGPALLSTGLLAFSGPFWFHSLVAEVYTLHSFFLCLILLLLLLWREKSDVRYLYVAALAYGLSAGNHATVAFILPAILVLYFCWNTRNIAGNLLTATLFFLIGFSVYAYLPIRSLAEPAMDWGNPETLKGFLYHVTDRKDADTHFSYFRNQAGGADAAVVSFWKSAGAMVASLWHVVRAFLMDVSTHLTPLAAIGFLAGAALCWKRNRPFFFFTLLIVAVNAAFFVGWRKESYFPSYIVVCLFTSLALFAFLFKLKKRKRVGVERKSAEIENQKSIFNGKPTFGWQRLVFIGMACVVPLNITGNFQKADRSGLYFGETLLQKASLSLENRGVFISGVSWFNMFYNNEVMRLRDDVTVVKAWDLLVPDAPHLLSSKRYPDLNLPDPEDHRFDTAEGSFKYVKDLLNRNWRQRPILMDQNLKFFEYFPLENNFLPHRNLLLKYRPQSTDNTRETAPDTAFAEFKDLMQEEMGKPGIYKTEWINKISFYAPSFAAYYHQNKRYENEREVLQLMNQFLGQGGIDWQFMLIDNLILDRKLTAAKEKLEILQTRFPNHFKTHLLEGLLLRAEGNLEAAKKLLEEVVALNPNAFRPRLELGRVRQLMGDGDRAEMELDAAKKNVRTLQEWKQLQQDLVG